MCKASAAQCSIFASRRQGQQVNPLDSGLDA